MKNLKTLILTCNTGEGHNSTAAALREVMENNGEFCGVCDTLEFMSKRFSKLIGKGHATMYRRVPNLFNKGYAMSEQHDSIFSEGTFLYKLITSGVKKLYRYVVENKIDNIVCVHPFSAMLATELKKEYGRLNITTSIVATDYTCSPGTNCSDMDNYFIPHNALREEFEGCGIPKEKISVSGIPVKQCFFQDYNKDEARKSLNLPLNKKIVLMCCGSMGCGHMEKISQFVVSSLNSDSMLIVICGSNKKLYNKLSENESENFKIVGFTNRMCDYMRSCDIFVTKPGGISTTEASAIKKPLVFVNAVAGCELRNREFFRYKDCAVTVSSNDEIPQAVTELLNNSQRCASLVSNLQKEFTYNGAKNIYNALRNNV